MIVVMRLCVIIVRNVISNGIKGTLALGNITLKRVAKKFHAIRDMIRFMPYKRCCRLVIQQVIKKKEFHLNIVIVVVIM
jgi:hypothetical protein